MQTLSNISIPVPCHENWDAMSLSEKGRFCNACSKTVIDFSLMSNNEVVEYFRNNAENVCGKFSNTQLKPQKDLSKKLRIFLYALFSIFLIEINGTAFGQDNSQKMASEESSHFSISGRITDEKNKSIAYAVVQVYEGGILKAADKSDKNGIYSINSLSNGIYQIRVSFIGMKAEEINEIPLYCNRRVDIEMVKGSMKKEIRIGGARYREPLVDPSNPGQQIMQRSDMKKLPIP